MKVGFTYEVVKEETVIQREDSVVETQRLFRFRAVVQGNLSNTRVCFCFRIGYANKLTLWASELTQGRTSNFLV